MTIKAGIPFQFRGLTQAKPQMAKKAFASVSTKSTLELPWEAICAHVNRRPASSVEIASPLRMGARKSSRKLAETLRRSSANPMRFQRGFYVNLTRNPSSKAIFAPSIHARAVIAYAHGNRPRTYGLDEILAHQAPAFPHPRAARSPRRAVVFPLGLARRSQAERRRFGTARAHRARATREPRALYRPQHAFTRAHRTHNLQRVRPEDSLIGFRQRGRRGVRRLARTVPAARSPHGRFREPCRNGLRTLRKLPPGSLVGRRHAVRPTPPDVYVEIAIVPLSRSKPQRGRCRTRCRRAHPAELRIAQGVAAIHTQQLSRTPRRIRIPATDAEPPCAHLGEGSGAERGRNMPLRPVLARRETRRRIRQSASSCRRGRAREGLGPQNRVGVRGHPRHHRFKRPAAHEVGDGQGRPRDGETAGNEMPLAGARLGTQADQAAITAARHHATGNAGRKNGTHDNNRPPKAPPPFAFSGKGLATFRDEAEATRQPPPKLPWEAICAHEASILPARTSRFPYIWSIRTSSSCFLWMSSLA